MILNDVGKMADQCWQHLTCRFANIKLDEYIIMPNHIHGIIMIVGAPLVGAQNKLSIRKWAGIKPAPTLGDIIGAFKSLTTNNYIQNVKQHHWPQFPGKLWQRNYYEHVVRNDDDLLKIRQYIINNPVNWEKDEYNKPAREISR